MKIILLLLMIVPIYSQNKMAISIYEYYMNGNVQKQEDYQKINYMIKWLEDIFNGVNEDQRILCKLGLDLMKECESIKSRIVENKYKMILRVKELTGDNDIVKIDVNVMNENGKNIVINKVLMVKIDIDTIRLDNIEGISDLVGILN